MNKDKGEYKHSLLLRPRDQPVDEDVCRQEKYNLFITHLYCHYNCFDFQTAWQDTFFSLHR